MTKTKPIILVDMDGPLADFDQAIWAALEGAGIKINCTRETQTVRYIDDAVSREDYPRVREFIDGAGWFRNLPAVEGAREGINALAKVFEVWICTKPLEKNPTCRDDKAAWTQEHLGKKWVDRVIIAGDKSLVVGSILLDDAPKPKWFPRAIWQPVIFPTPWNGVGSIWEGLPRWTWGDSIDALVEYGLSDRMKVKASGGVDFEDVPFPLVYK